MFIIDVEDNGDATYIAALFGYIPEAETICGYIDGISSLSLEIEVIFKSYY